jgi:hypothetical protein
MTAAVTTTVATATAIATEAATFVAARTTSATTTGAAAILTWSGFVNFQHATAQFFSVELIDSCGRLFVCRHLNKCESS